jgi:hypothetical protein
MNVTVDSRAMAILRRLLDDEGGDAVVRIREAKLGTGCRTIVILRAGIDEREDNDFTTEVDSIPFVMSEDIADQYGLDFKISLDESGMPVAEAAS